MGNNQTTNDFTGPVPVSSKRSRERSFPHHETKETAMRGVLLRLRLRGLNPK